MNWSNATKRNAIIAGAVLIVLALILWRWWSRSTYTVTGVTSGAAAPEGPLYSNLAQCTNTFIQSAITSLTVHTGTPVCDTQGNVTVTTLLSHSYNVNDQIYVGGVSTDGTTLSTNINGLATVTQKAGPNSYAYKAGGPCSPVGTLLGNPGYSYRSNDTVTRGLDQVRSDCYASNVSSYMNVRCTWTPAQPNAAGITPNTYASDIAAINAAYNPVILQLSVQGGAATVAQAELARKADYTSAIRKFYQTVCPPGYYAVTTALDPGSAVPATNPNYYPQAPYSSYSSSSSTGLTGGSWFDASKITPTNIATWATYATGGTNAAKTGASIYPPGTTNAQIASDIGPGTTLVTSRGTSPNAQGFTWGST